MTKRNFETLEVGERYLDRLGRGWKILSRLDYPLMNQFASQSEKQITTHYNDGVWGSGISNSDLITHIKPEKKHRYAGLYEIALHPVGPLGNAMPHPLTMRANVLDDGTLKLEE